MPCRFCHMSDLLKQYLLRSKNIFSASSSELSQKLILISPYLFSAHAEKLSAFFVLHALPSFADKNCFFLFPAFKKFKSRFSLYSSRFAMPLRVGSHLNRASIPQKTQKVQPVPTNPQVKKKNTEPKANKANESNSKEFASLTEKRSKR